MKTSEIAKTSTKLSLKNSGASSIKKKFPETINFKMFETNSSFHVK